MVVEGAVQHGLSITTTLLILILFTSCFPAYASIFRHSAWLVETTSLLAFFRRPTSGRGYFRSRSALLIDIIQTERLAELPAFGPEAPHVVGECGFTNPLSEGGHRAA
jgi:hypothetical protein